MMAETVRDYGRERLEEAGKSEMTLRRHADYCLRLAQEMAAKLLGPDQEIGLARLDREYQNLRAALSWSQARSPTVGLRLAAELWRYFFARGSFIEGKRWLEAALATPEAEEGVARVRALNGLAVMVWATGDLERALELQNASFSLACEIDDAWGMAAAEGDRAIVAFMNGGDANQAQKATTDALKKFRALGDRMSEGFTLIALGSIAQSKRNLVQAARHFQEALTISRQNGDRRGQALSLFNLGQTARLSGDLRRSSAWHHEGLALAHRMGLQEDMLYSLAGIAGIAVERGQFRRAARLLGAVTALAGWMAIPLQPTEQAQFERDSATTRAAMSDETFIRAWEAGRGLALEDAVAEALEITEPSELLDNGHKLTKQRRNGWQSESLRDHPQDATDGQLRISHESGEQFRNTHGLSQRELEVLLLLVAGYSDREIAEQLFISCQTAMTHVKHIRAKLAVHSRAAAAAYAIRHGIV
jgi:ATP/maltotriose-dependent transcriptional regulator MalT